MAAIRSGEPRLSSTFRIAALLPAVALLAGCTQALAGPLAECAERITGSAGGGPGHLISFPSHRATMGPT